MQNENDTTNSTKYVAEKMCQKILRYEGKSYFSILYIQCTCMISNCHLNYSYMVTVCNLALKYTIFYNGYSANY